MVDEKMNILPLPEIKLRKDDIEASNFFGKTAYYDPNQKEIVLYVNGRHNKDIVRSFSHEMVHHMQNIENRLPNISTQNTNEDDRLLELEKEAYLVGNITFRNWEDNLKNSGDKDSLSEKVTVNGEALQEAKESTQPSYLLSKEVNLISKELIETLKKNS
jgi:hypothetical protein